MKIEKIKKICIFTYFSIFLPLKTLLMEKKTNPSMKSHDIKRNNRASGSKGIYITYMRLLYDYKFLVLG